MGWGANAIIAFLVFAVMLFGAGIIALIIATLTFLVAKRALKTKSPKPGQLSLLIAFVVGAFSCAVVYRLAWIIPMWSITHPPPPTIEDVTGVWVPNEWPIEWMHEHEYVIENIKIEFFDDHSFLMKEIPSIWIAEFVETDDESFSGSGTWEMVRSLDDWYIPLSFEDSSRDQEPLIYQAPWLPRLELIYFQVPGEENQASFMKCGPIKTRMHDSALDPYRDVIQNIDREGLGFSPISDDAWVEIQPIYGPYIYIDIYGDTSRTITLTEKGGSYEWLSEQEISYGPNQRPDDGGMSQERIVVEFQTEELNGVPVNQTSVVYSGNDPRINSLGPLWLRLHDVRPYLDEWKIWRSTQPPRPIDLCP